MYFKLMQLIWEQKHFLHITEIFPEITQKFQNESKKYPHRVLLTL